MDEFFRERTNVLRNMLDTDPNAGTAGKEKEKILDQTSKLTELWMDYRVLCWI